MAPRTRIARTLTLLSFAVILVASSTAAMAQEYTFTTFAGAAPGYFDGTGKKAGFHYPSGVAVDGSGTVYVADASNHTIRKITAAGEVTTHVFACEPESPGSHEKPAAREPESCSLVWVANDLRVLRSYFTAVRSY